MPKHVQYFTDSQLSLKTSDNQLVRIIELEHDGDDNTLSNWSTHLRNHYCADSEIDELRQGTGLTRSQYLENIKFPTSGHIVSADFSEILVADYFQFMLGYQVPRTRYETKTNRNMSPPGIDILAYKIQKEGQQSSRDQLLTCEVKAALQRKKVTTLTEAVSDSRKDFRVRKAESLNAIKQRLKDRNRHAESNLVERFQDKTDRPYREISGAVVVHSIHTWDDNVVASVSCSDHPNRSELILMAIKGDRLMDLARHLYRRACDEA